MKTLSILFCLAILLAQPLQAAPGDALSEPAEAVESIEPAAGAERPQGYAARKESLRSVFEAISTNIGKPIVVSKLAASKKMTGRFNLANREIVNLLSRQFSLINYFDGHTIYVYDASETKNAMITMKNAAPSSVTNFLKQAKLYDARYPLRSNSGSTLYVSGPPIYVDLVAKMASSIDQESVSLDEKYVEIIKVHNTFVVDRTFTRREGDHIIPGIATLVQEAISNERVSAQVKRGGSPDGTRAPANDTQAAPASTDRSPLLDAPITAAPMAGRDTSSRAASASDVRIIAYPETNSLLVKGTPEQVRFVRNLVRALDEEKRHIELALWIVDLEREDFERLGVDWHGSISLGGSISASLNGGTASLSTVAGPQFLAAVTALARDRRAQIVSRPVLLTQENTPAVFDSSQTFYTKLVGERAVDLKDVTYGTMVNVVPRFNVRDDIELSLNIEDGNAKSVDGASDVLPTVNRTKISTVARVPKGKSLLVGGYTRGESGDTVEKIPGLGDLPWVGGLFRHKSTINRNTVRVFLISPREVADGMTLEARDIDQDADFSAVIQRLDHSADLIEAGAGERRGAN
ncbi:hypothetical protein WL21_04665 [Burkholderia ubonensis]|uniref:type III secretion system outer membrane ring subunit SctC n=1 Tax=Burkholderia ubonensis TaxID=101571 RepID=UPI00075B8CB0|nr:type III secretion system outer membrane ring subunit SctC [Burkholderia ubonensis]KVO87679.1 hypothetical protein WJ81_15635 [Burkholderia ubonensis]KVZ57296.1 hypothetical protein WL20_23420 [Burkholderia ubonensis]KVZ72993.1 hypothetical protein WL21_04665 [Burkholderia ubonensis]